MKLSEAIRLGAMLRPQTYEKLFGDGKSCAMGAVLEASGVLAYGQALDFPQGQKCELMFPILATKVLLPEDVSPWPHHPLYEIRVWNAVVFLNNNRRWTREQIADWVETLEAKEAETIETEELVTA